VLVLTATSILLPSSPTSMASLRLGKRSSTFRKSECGK